MPYSRKTRRQPARHVVTLTQLTDANVQVTDEMENLGLWFEALDEVTVWLVQGSFVCYGWYREAGDIHIPALTGAQLSDLLLGYHTRLTDVLRHEWAHAVADRCPELVDNKRFVRVFGEPYQSDISVRAFDPKHHLTRYASTNPCEDFAEVFHYYLRHKGRLPVRLRNKPVIARKWRFIARMAQRLTGCHDGF